MGEPGPLLRVERVPPKEPTGVMLMDARGVVPGLSVTGASRSRQTPLGRPGWHSLTKVHNG